MSTDDVYPDDSVSQVGNMEERNRRYEKEAEPDYSPPSQEDQAVIATRLRENVREYMDAELKLKKLLAATRELRKERKSLEKKLITDMNLLEVENLQLKQGQLVARRTNPKVPLTKSSVISALSKNLKDQTLIDTVMDILYNNRDRYEKVELKHYSKKNQ